MEQAQSNPTPSESRPLGGSRAYRSVEERNPISPFFLVHKTGCGGERGETDKTEGRREIPIGWKGGEVCEEETGRSVKLNLMYFRSAATEGE